jgi:anti-anti-sigma factor
MSASPNRLVIIDQGPCSVSLTGEIDAHSAPAVVDRLSGCSGDDTDVVINLAAVTFMDSSGLRVLIDIRQRLESSPNALVLHSPSDPVRRLLEVAGLDGHFTIER